VEAQSWVVVAAGQTRPLIPEPRGAERGLSSSREFEAFTFQLGACSCGELSLRSDDLVFIVEEQAPRRQLDPGRFEKSGS
jgi:hypothetical protein